MTDVTKKRDKRHCFVIQKDCNLEKNFCPFFVYRMNRSFVMMPLMTVVLCYLLCDQKLFAQEIVVNKLRNGGSAQSGESDVVELLVVRDRLDLRGYTLRDFATTTTNSLITDSATSGSGWFTFAQRPEWQSLRAGTLLLLFFNANEFINQGDTVILASLRSPLFQQGGNFNIAVRDMVMLKRPNAEIDGTSGNVHAFSVGLSVASVAGITPLLRTSDPVSTLRPYAVPDNPSENLNDYNGNRASIELFAGFGLANNPIHQRFLDSLRRTRITSVHNSTNESLKISPHPARAECFVEFQLQKGGALRILLTDIAGRRREVYKSIVGTGKQSIALSLRDIPPGTYFVRVETEREHFSGRLVVR